MEGHVVSVNRVIAAPAPALFALVSDASRHPEIDGSGALEQLRDGSPPQLSLGSTFGMRMKTGVPYSMSNTVIEFEPNRRIAWKTVQSGPLGRFIGGRIWRYEFEAVEGGTRVTESWDISEDKQKRFLAKDKVATATAASMTKSLEHLDSLTTTASPRAR